MLSPCPGYLPGCPGLWPERTGLAAGVAGRQLPCARGGLCRPGTPGLRQAGQWEAGLVGTRAAAALPSPDLARLALATTAGPGGLLQRGSPRPVGGTARLRAGAAGWGQPG